MSKQEGIIIIEDDGILYNYRVMSDQPSSSCSIVKVPIIGQFPRYQTGRYRVDDLHINVIDSFENSFFQTWADGCMYYSYSNGKQSPKKDFILKLNKHNISIYGALINSFAIEILYDEDIMLNRTFKNYNFLKREVLFEKIGNEKIRIILSITLKIDSYLVEN